MKYMVIGLAVALATIWIVSYLLAVVIPDPSWMQLPTVFTGIVLLYCAGVTVAIGTGDMFT